MSESRVKKSAYNMISGFAYHAIVLVLSFVSRTVFIQTLGNEYNGLNATFSDVLTLLSMADLGFNTAMAYSFYKPLADGDKKKLASLVNFYRKVYNVIAITVTILGLSCIPFLKYFVKAEQNMPYVRYYLCSLAGVVISYLFVYRTTILTADQKNYEVVKINIWVTLLRTILQILSLLLYKNYIIYLVIGIVAQFTSNLIASRKADKLYPYIKDKQYIEQVDAEFKTDIIKNMKSVFIYKISGTLFNATDNLIISRLMGIAVTGLYSNYLMVSNKLLLIAQIVFSSLTAGVGNVMAKEKPEKRLEVFNAMQSASFIFCGIISSAFCILANDLVYVWLGKEFQVSMVTVLAITLNTYLACVLQPLWIYRDATGLYMRTRYIMLLGAIINIVLSVLLGKWMGLSGVIFASAISRLSTYFWYEPKLLFEEYFNHKVGKYYLSLLGNLGLVMVTIFVLTKLTSGFVVETWFDLIGKGIIIGCICCVIFTLTYSKTEGFQIIMNKLKQMFKKR